MLRLHVKNRAGFSLMEVLVALLILLIGVTSILCLFPVGVNKVRLAVRDTRCTMMAHAAWSFVDVVDCTVGGVQYTMLNDPMHRRAKPLRDDPTNDVPPSPIGDPEFPENFLQSPFLPAKYDYQNTDKYVGNALPSQAYVDPDGAGPFHYDVWSYYQTTAFNFLNNPNLYFGIGTTLNSQSTQGVPLLIDPVWVHRENLANQPASDRLDLGWPFQNGVAVPPPPPAAEINALTHRQTILDYSALNAVLANGGTPLALHPLRVVTTWRAATIQNDSTAGIDPRGAYVQRWFTSAGDLHYKEGIFGMPERPAVNGVAPNYNLNDTGSIGYPLAVNQISAGRDYDYSWALMYQRDVSPVLPAPPIPDPQGTPPDLGAEGKAAVMVFYRRDFNKYPHPRSVAPISDPAFNGIRVPYATAIASFVNGSSRITLRYPQNIKPIIKRGNWICECSIFGAGVYTFNPAVPDTRTNDRRSFNFHRIADYEEVVDAVSGDNLYVITLESTVSGYQDFPVAVGSPSRLDVDPAPSSPQVATTPAYYPVFIFDGLQEVYSRQGVWRP